MKWYHLLCPVAALAAGWSLPVLTAESPPAPGTIVTVVGIGRRGFSGDNGPATRAQLNLPRGIAFDAAGDFFVGDSYNLRVREVRQGGIITTVAGTGRSPGSQSIGEGG